MNWLRAWWRQVLGLPCGNPWDDDPAIVAERQRQHDVANRLAAVELEQEIYRRRQAEGGQAR